MSSSANKYVASKGAIQAPEESGWTQYLEDFSLEKRENILYSDDDNQSFGSPSLVSDAASPANNGARNFSGNREVFASAAMACAQQFPKRLNMKKQRYQGYSCDDLEDTASSPVNSPKVTSLKQMETSYRRTDDGLRNSLEKDGGSDQLLRQRTDERSRINLDGKKIDYSELKSKGLCLMPFSMLVNYMG